MAGGADGSFNSLLKDYCFFRSRKYNIISMDGFKPTIYTLLYVSNPPIPTKEGLICAPSPNDHVVFKNIVRSQYGHIVD